MHFKTGKQSRYRQYLQPAQIEVFDRLMQEEEYTSLQQEIALARMSLIKAIGEYGELEATALRRLLKASGYLEEVLASEYDVEDLENAVKPILDVVEDLRRGHGIEERVSIQREQVRRLVETENKKLAGDQNAMSAERVLFLFTYMLQSVRTHHREVMEFLKTYHPGVVADNRLPDFMRMVAADIDPLFPAKQLPAGGETE